ncbi:neuromedin-U receptor 1 [Denticeps clupeoides]|uniref:G-protein coupled receptors family 1 profile domain-containing protein n=1 Tax=Denticeps clupeoides TaxID=299321 RepID=A0AAY4A9W2_9TELE|nr:neuromedin-U receptor 1 [Denticeps clupeoides]XP_028833534.1 neuromedin-U receptor 1 [Denticeps clupeoides]XP_028833535.1 neuromedin-U receptor 1 [Denticeps clupeoides]
MDQYNCSANAGSTWCLEAKNCKERNMSAEDLEDLCLSRTEYLEKYLGPRRSSLFLPVCVTYLSIFVVGAVGNVLTCTVIARYKVMRTPTNYYLFSLAVSDLLVLLLGMPLELYELWSNYPFLLGAGGCYFKTFLFETVCFASVLNVTALSGERYMAVVHPLQVRYMATRAHAKRTILTLWALSMLCAIPNTSLHGVLFLPPRFGQQFPESAICGLVRPTWIYNLLVQVTALVFFLLPMLTISVLYLLIGLRLYRERVLVPQVVEINIEAVCSHQNYLKSGRHRQVTKMLCVLVMVFGICWAPFHIDRVMWSYIDHWTIQHHQVFEYVHLISGVFFYLSSAVNPILYNLMSTRFREMFKEVACQRVTRRYSVTQLTSRSTICEKAV